MSTTPVSVKRRWCGRAGAHVRRPKLDYESRAVGLDRNEVGALLVAARLAGVRDHALVSLLALNGLRISEALGGNIEDLAVERGHRTLRILRKGGKPVTIPLAPRTASAIDLVVGERLEGPLFVAVTGGPLDRHAAARIVKRLSRAGKPSHVSRPRLHLIRPAPLGRVAASPSLVPRLDDDSDRISVATKSPKFSRDGRLR